MTNGWARIGLGVPFLRSPCTTLAVTTCFHSLEGARAFSNAQWYARDGIEERIVGDAPTDVYSERFDRCQPVKIPCRINRQPRQSILLPAPLVSIAAWHGRGRGGDGTPSLSFQQTQLVVITHNARTIERCDTQERETSFEAG